VAGVDASKNMLDLASEKKAYIELGQHVLGQKDYLETFPIPHKNKYDFVTAAGLICNNYMDEHIFE